MGEMAEWVNDQLYDPYIDGPEHLPDQEDGDGPAGVGCRYCLGGPFWWMETSTGWRLVDAQGSLHSCAEYPTAR